MTDDGYDSKNKKSPCVRTHVRTQEGFLYIIRHIRHPSPKKIKD